MQSDLMEFGTITGLYKIMANVSNPYGYTPVGQGTQNFMDILKTITGGAQTPMSPQVAQQGYQSALSSAIGLGLNQPAAEEQARQDLTQQSGIPGLQKQYGDLGKLFEMYLADTGLAGKYANTSNTNPYANPALTAGTPEGEAPNPYLASPEALAASATPVGGGFTDPSLTTQAMGAPVSAATNLMDLVSKAIGLQEGKVTKKMGDVSANYQAALSVLGTLANVFKEERDRAAKAAGDAGNKELENKILEALNVINGGTESSDVSGYERFALLQGEANAKRYAEEREKESGQEWAYRPAADGSGWEVLRPSVVQTGQTGEPSRLVNMINLDDGKEISVSEEDVWEWTLKGYEEY